MGPCRKTRTVEKTNTAEFQVKTPEGKLSHCGWPKASQLHETTNGFKIVEGGETSLEYEWGTQP